MTTEPETPLEERAEEETGWHPVNVGHLVMGTAFVGLVVVWALLSSGAVELDDARWLLPFPWLVAGLVGVAATVLRNVRRRPGRMSGWT